MNEAVKYILSYFPIELKNTLMQYVLNRQNQIQEIRIRANQPVCLTIDGKNLVAKNTFTSEEIVQEIFEKICDYSVYTHQEDINNGFVTLKNGSRVGVCGTAVYDNEKIISIKKLTSLNFRIAGDYVGCSNKIMSYNPKNLIIVGPPGSGKTTLIRDIARNLSSQNLRVCVVDERYEISGTSNCFYLGTMTDCLKGYKKSFGLNLAIRTLSPQYIIFDEISTVEECKKVFECLNSGVNIVTTVHAYTEKQFFSRPVCQIMIKSNFFDTVAFLGESAGKVEKILKLDGEKVCEL